MLATSGRTNEFCSMACYNTMKSGRLRGIVKSDHHRRALSMARAGVPVPALWKPVITRACLHCGRQFIIDRHRPVAVRAVQRFCGTRCWYAFVREHSDASGTFRGGRMPYYGPNWNDQARKARRRDRHTCQDCGVVQPRPLLDVHHLIPRRVFQGEHVTANAIENLVTVCKACHMRREVVLRRREAVA